MSKSLTLDVLKLSIDNLFALPYHLEVNTDCISVMICRKMTPSTYRLVPYNFVLNFCYSANHLVRLFLQKCTAQRKHLPLRFQNRKRHCFPWSLSPGNGGKTGITEKKRRKRILLMDGAKKVQKDRDRNQVYESTRVCFPSSQVLQVV